jgi:2,3-bisphosphoglycerate-independent phosphoglycerate mutase
MKPVVLVIMDGVGIGAHDEGDAVFRAKTPNLDRMLSDYPHVQLKAHGTAVGLPSDGDMGNSEVGHNTLGCGQVFPQGARLVNESIQSGRIFSSGVWQTLSENCRKNHRPLHLIGLLSDGNVHSHIDHLFALLHQARKEGIETVRCHILLDGRDVPATSALEYVDALEALLQSLSCDGFDYAIASGGGRMQITMDRYEADWEMVHRGWQTHVLGEGQQFSSAREAIEAARAETGCIDQDLPPFVIVRDGVPLGPISNGDSVILFNFRGDRALEISRAFDTPDFSQFDRGGVTDVLYAGILQYDGDLNIPSRYLVDPPAITETLTEVLCRSGIRQYALSETQKFGHVTYFWNGNRGAKFDEALETWEEIPSDQVPFDQKPAMKCREITDRLIAAMESGQYDFLRCNFPNGDMVGHTGNLEAMITSMEALDPCLGEIEDAAKRLGYTLLLTADHGNADQMYDQKKDGSHSVRTAHSLNPVPFVLCGEGNLRQGDWGLANVAPTIAQLLGVTPPKSWHASLLD